MNNILSIKIGNSFKKIFLQNGFYYQTLGFSPLHSHNYSEIHAVCEGNVRFCIDGREYIMEAGSILIIPPRVFHWVMAESDDAVRIAFQIEYNAKGFVHKKISPQVLSELATEINLAYKSNNYITVSPYLSLICCKLTDAEQEAPTPISDYAFLIYEFFSNRYNEDIRLKDLAEELRLSEKQTQRLVKKYTGKTFGRLLTEKRIAMADALLGSSEFLKSDVCERVGYHSYGGFRKAYKRHFAEK